MNAEVLKTYGNIAIVAVPERKFPGVWIAADTFSTVADHLKEISEKYPDDEDVEELLQRLTDYLNAYAIEMKARGIRLPFNLPWFEQP